MADNVPHYVRQGISADTSQTPISVLVMNSVEPMPEKCYETYVAYRGILLGALKRLQFTTDFKFTFMEYQDYGAYLNSVNNLYEDREKHTYWQLEVQKPDGSVIVPDVGIGCYIPDTNEEIILNYTKY
ncbi:hypothetical protein NQD34_011894 [Periophthalmus magnuspinnatus]|nr:hypothetical protein NQD34_011894 [Periophthalmus magnuspinnatus]